MSFLFFLIIFLFIIFAVVLNFGVAIIRLIFNGLNPFRKKRYSNEFDGYGNSSSGQQTNEPHKKSKKVFKETDGEYVDFEEIK